MAKKKTEAILPVSEKSGLDELDELINSTFQQVVDFSKEEANVKNWYDIGNYALNYTISKNLRAGVPSGRIIGLSGLKGAGKSLLTMGIGKDKNIEKVVVIETEGGGSSAGLASFIGVPAEKIVSLKASTFMSYRINKNNGKVEEVKDNEVPQKLETETYIYFLGATLLLKRFINALEFKGLQDKKILVICDSIVNLQSVREKEGTTDMGKRAQDMGIFFRTFDNAFERTNICFAFTNKLYVKLDGSGQFVEAGGEAPAYNASCLLRLTELQDNDELSDSDLSSEKERRKTSLGNSFKTVRIKITKSRFGTEGRNCWIMLDSNLGVIKHSGLFILLRDFGIIKKNGSRYEVGGFNNNQSFYKKDFISLFMENEDENIDLFQKMLNEAEKNLREEKERILLSASDESDMEQAMISAGVVVDETEDILSEFADTGRELSKELIKDMERD